MAVVHTHYGLDGHLQCNGIFQFLNQVVSKFVFNAGQTKYKREQIMERNTPGITKEHLHFNANLQRGPQLFPKPQAAINQSMTIVSLVWSLLNWHGFLLGDLIYFGEGRQGQCLQYPKSSPRIAPPTVSFSLYPWGSAYKAEVQFNMNCRSTRPHGGGIGSGTGLKNDIDADCFHRWIWIFFFGTRYS